MILGSCPLPPIVATPWGTSSEAHSSRRLRTEHQHMFPDRRAKYARLVSSAISWTKARESKRLLRLDTSTLYAPASLPPTVSGLRPAPALRSGARTLRASYRVGTIYLERVSVNASLCPPPRKHVQSALYAATTIAISARFGIQLRARAHLAGTC